MILSTTPSIEDHSITEYPGIVTGEAILGANIVRDIFAGITAIVGGWSGKHEQELAKARKIAPQEISEEAERLNANGVVGVDLDYKIIREGMLMVTTSGTAVKFR